MLEDVHSFVGCAVARRLFPDLEFADPLAENIADQLALDEGAFDERRLRAATVRTIAIDGIIRHFFQRYPCGLAVALRPGLCTRFSRMDNGSLRWIELESSDVAALKTTLMTTPDRHVIASWEGSSDAWMDLLRAAGDLPTIVVAQGGLLRVAPHGRDVFLTNAAARLPCGTELVADYDATEPMRRSSRRSDASLEVPASDRAWVRFPRIRFVGHDEYPCALAHDLAGLDGVSRLFRGRGVPSVAHLRFC